MDGYLRSRLFENYRSKKKRRRRWPEELIDPVTGKELGVQENDVWLVAQALEYNLIFATHDRMDHIKQVCDPDLPLNWQDWGE